MLSKQVEVKLQALLAVQSLSKAGEEARCRLRASAAQVRHVLEGLSKGHSRAGWGSLPSVVTWTSGCKRVHEDGGAGAGEAGEAVGQRFEWSSMWGEDKSNRGGVG